MRIGVGWIYVVHRYAGIALSILMLTWCLSGIVMMYVPYPALSQPARLAGLAPLDWTLCCHPPRGGRVSPGMAVEMMNGHLVLRPGRGGKADLIDLGSGRSYGPIGAADVRAVAEAFARGNHLVPGAVALETIQSDQWTVAGGFARDRPLYRIALNDPAGTEVYVSGTSGAVVLSTDRAQRFWNYLGAVPHWLYFTSLRAQPQLWTQVVIWTSLLGSLLVLAGLFIGIRQWLRARRANRWSPYCGFMWWHHVPGLLFGILLLTWTVSGLLSMNPWGLLEGRGAGSETRRLAGAPVGRAQLGKLLAALTTAPPAGMVSLQVAPFDGQLYTIASRADGVRMRLGPDGKPAPLATDMTQISEKLQAKGAPVFLPDGDDYYLPREEGRARLLPVWRFGTLNNEVLYYVDPVSGALAGKVDDNERASRWLQGGFHRMDFTALMRQRPLWDIITLFLMLGVTFIAGSGLYAASSYLLRGRRAGDELSAISPTGSDGKA